MDDAETSLPHEGTLWEISVHMIGFEDGTFVTISATTCVAALRQAILNKCRLKGYGVTKLQVKLTVDGEPLKDSTKLYSVPFVERKDHTRHVHIGGLFTESPPRDLSKETILYDREASAFLLAKTFSCLKGILVVPIMDQCWGAGKTSLAWQFRGIVQKNPELMSKLAFSLRLKHLMSAVYVHIRLDSRMLSDEFLVKESRGELKDEDYDAVICQHVNFILEGCLPKTGHTNRLNIAEVTIFMNSEAPDTRFIFHFEEMGAFESVSASLALTMIYRVWVIAKELSRSHFCVLTGRSALLHLVGKGVAFEGKTSPTNHPREHAVTIPLPLLSATSIAKMFTEQGLADWISRNKNLSRALLLTGGIPRVVCVLIEFVQAGGGNNLLDLEEDESSEAGMRQSHALQTALSGECPVTIPENEEDIARFNCLLELSWGQIQVPVDALIRSEPVPAALARLGLYSNLNMSNFPFVAPIDSRQIVVPLYQLRALAFIPRSLCAIREYEDDDGCGTRLEEAGFRRVLFLRLCSLFLGKDTRREWSAVGLPFLDEQKIPFPPTQVEQCYVLPKIGGGGDEADDNDEDNNSAKQQSSTLGEAKEVMQVTHEGKRSSPAIDESDVVAGSHKKTTCSSQLLLPELFARLKLSQYYYYHHPLSPPASSGATALVRVGPNKVIQFQFITPREQKKQEHSTENPMAETQVDTNGFPAAERVAAAAEGWETVVVLIRCPAPTVRGGRGKSEEEQEARDVVKEHTSFFEGKAKVTSLLLSRASVERFLGQSALEKMDPTQDELAIDQQGQVRVVRRSSDETRMIFNREGIY